MPKTLPEVFDAKTVVTLRMKLPHESIVGAIHEGRGKIIEVTHTAFDHPFNPELVTFDIEFDDFGHAASFLFCISENKDIWDVSWRCAGPGQGTYRAAHLNDYD